MLEAGAQTAVTAHKGVHGCFKRARIEQPFKIELELANVDVGSLRLIEGMEQKTFLQRRERQDLLEVGVFALQPVDLGLGERNQRQIGRGAATGAGDGNMVHQSLERREPALRQIANSLVGNKMRPP